MGNTLVMRTDAPHSLNFLVYIQNIFLNRSKNMDELKFPYILTKCRLRKDFKLQYKVLWDDVSKRISEHPINDLKIFTEEKELFYQGLFVEDEDSLREFNIIYHSFKVWWDSFAGHFAIERSMDENREKIYTELANFLGEKGIKPQKELNISIIYDECLLVDVETFHYFAILSIKDCSVNYKESIPKLQLCFY